MEGEHLGDFIERVFEPIEFDRLRKHCDRAGLCWIVTGDKAGGNASGGSFLAAMTPRPYSLRADRPAHNHQIALDAFHLRDARQDSPAFEARALE